MTAWYRYVDGLEYVGDFESVDTLFHDADGGPMAVKITLRKYRVISETPRTVLLDVGAYTKPKRVLKDARRRFAYPTTELALKSFRRRKVCQQQHGEATVNRAKAALELVAEMEAAGEGEA